MSFDEKAKLARKLSNKKSHGRRTADETALIDEVFHEQRRTSIGGTDVSKILGVSPWGTIRDVWRAKTGREPKRDIGARAEVGTQLEPLLMRWYEEEWGCTLVRASHKRCNKLPFLGAHLDALVDGNGHMKGRRNVQIKTCRNLEWGGWGEPGTDQIPTHYFAQVQHEMYVAHLPTTDVYVAELDRIEKKGHTFHIDFDEAFYLQKVRPQLVAFWRNYVETDTEPPVPEGVIDPAELRWPTDNGHARPADPNELAMLAELADLHSRIKEGHGSKADADRKDALAHAIKTSMGPEQVLYAPGDPTKKLATFSKPETKRAWRKRAIDLLESGWPDAYEELTEPTERSRMFRPNYDKILATKKDTAG